jgi:hypothetical protein
VNELRFVEELVNTRSLELGTDDIATPGVPRRVAARAGTPSRGVHRRRPAFARLMWRERVYAPSSPATIRPGTPTPIRAARLTRWPSKLSPPARLPLGLLRRVAEPVPLVVLHGDLRQPRQGALLQAAPALTTTGA